MKKQLLGFYGELNGLSYQMNEKNKNNEVDRDISLLNKYLINETLCVGEGFGHILG